MKIFASLLLLFFSLNSIGQEKDLGNMLKGTTVLEGSNRNYVSALFHGFWLDSLYASPCLGSSEEPIPAEISSISFPNDSMLLVEIKVEANCGHDFLGEIEIVEDSILNLIYHSYGGRSICYCCFGLTYQIRLYQDEAVRDPIFFDKVRYAMVGYERDKMKELPWGK